MSHRGQEHARKLLAQALEPKQLPPQLILAKSLSEEEIFENVAGPFTREKFCQAVLATKEYIKEGQAFQIVLSQRFLDSHHCAPNQYLSRLAGD